MQRIILDSNKKKLGFDELNYLVYPDGFATDLSGLKVPLYNETTGKFWIYLDKIGNVRSVDNIKPNSNGNVDLSNRYYTIEQIKEINKDFTKYPKLSSNDDSFKVLLIHPQTNETFYINLGDVQRLKVYTSPDDTIKIDDNEIYLNVTNIKSESTHIYSEGLLPLDVTMDEEYNEITDVIVNGKIIPREMYRLNSKQSVKILENLMDIFYNTPETLYVCVKGIKLFK